MHDRNASLRSEYLSTERELSHARARGDSTAAAEHERRLLEIATSFTRANDSLIGPVVQRYRLDRSRSNWNDYEQAARLGLWEAFQKWDPDRSTFGTFSRSYIEGHVRRSVSTYEHDGKSYETFCAVPKVNRIVAEHDLDGADPKLIAELSGTGRDRMSARTVEIALMGSPSSLDAPVGDGDGATRGELIAEDTAQRAGSGQDIDPSVLAELTDDLSARELFLVLRRGISNDGRWPLDGSGVDTNYYRLADIVGEGREGLRRAHEIACSLVMHGPEIVKVAEQDLLEQAEEQRDLVAVAACNGQLPTDRTSASRYHVDVDAGTVTFLPKYNLTRTNKRVKEHLPVQMTVTRLRSLLADQLTERLTVEVDPPSDTSTDPIDTVEPAGHPDPDTREEVTVLIGLLFGDEPHVEETLRPRCVVPSSDRLEAARRNRIARAQARARQLDELGQLAFAFRLT